MTTEPRDTKLEKPLDTLKKTLNTCRRDANKHHTFFSASAKEIRNEAMPAMIIAIKSATTRLELTKIYDIIRKQQYMNEPAFLRLKHPAYSISEEGDIYRDKKQTTSHIMSLIGEYCAAKYDYLTYHNGFGNVQEAYDTLANVSEKLESHLKKNYKGAGTEKVEFCSSLHSKNEHYVNIQPTPSYKELI